MRGLGTSGNWRVTAHAGRWGVAGLGKECLGMSVVVFRIPGIPRWVGSGKDRRAKPEDFGAQGGTPPFLLICNLYY